MGGWVGAAASALVLRPPSPHPFIPRRRFCLSTPSLHPPSPPLYCDSPISIPRRQFCLATPLPHPPIPSSHVATFVLLHPHPSIPRRCICLATPAPSLPSSPVAAFVLRPPPSIPRRQFCLAPPPPPFIPRRRFLGAAATAAAEAEAGRIHREGVLRRAAGQEGWDKKRREREELKAMRWEGKGDIGGAGW